jgi:hypothetical protein
MASILDSLKAQMQRIRPVNSGEPVKAGEDRWDTANLTYSLYRGLARHNAPE